MHSSRTIGGPLSAESRRRYGPRAVILMAAVVAVLWQAAGRSGETSVLLPPPEVDNPKHGDVAVETAVLAGGCFWGVQGVFQHTKGIKQVLSGYAGGERASATYTQVGTGRTGHAESVEVKFDPRDITYGEILRIYFSVAHDPTQLNRQGPDIGSQYRSAIFYADESQRRIAHAYVAQLERARVFSQPIVTRIDALKGFYPAETYHQDFLIRHPDHPYIVVNDLPKIANLKRLYPDEYREQPIVSTGN